MNHRNHSLKKGDVLAERYLIVGLLGIGGMGNVFLAEDLKLSGKRWAVKECAMFTDDIHRKQFADEAEILVKLQHPNLPNIVDYYLPNEEGNSYLVMDYIQGKTLLQLFEAEGKAMDYDRVVKYALQICDLFDYLHHNRTGPIIYRDLKPSNVMIDDQDQVRLIDFGIARNYKEGQIADTVQIGTLGFAAPEQFENRQTDQRTDLYNLGALMYYLLSEGKYYYTTQKRLDAVTNKWPIPLVNIVHLLLQDDPDHRYQNAEEVSKDLKQLQLQTPTYQYGSSESAQARTTYHLLPNKLTVIASMYAGAGSTFVTIALAKALDSLGIPHAVVEYPLNDAEYYSLLFGEKHAPANYSFAVDNSLVGKECEAASEWKDGCTTWYPLNPLTTGAREVWDIDDTYKLLYNIKTPIILLDISHLWDDKDIDKMMMIADEVVIVVNPLPSKLNEPNSQGLYHKLGQFKKAGKSIHFIANRDHPFSARKLWLRSLPFPPLCKIPNIPYQDMIESIWKGNSIYQNPEYKSKLLNAIHPLLSRLVPGEYLSRSREEKKAGALSWFTKYK